MRGADRFTTEENAGRRGCARDPRALPPGGRGGGMRARVRTVARSESTARVTAGPAQARSPLVGAEIATRSQRARVAVHVGRRRRPAAPRIDGRTPGVQLARGVEAWIPLQGVLLGRGVDSPGRQISPFLACLRPGLGEGARAGSTKVEVVLRHRHPCEPRHPPSSVVWRTARQSREPVSLATTRLLTSVGRTEDGRWASGSQSWNETPK